MKKILVGFDGSETAARAADQAADLARAFGAELHVATVIAERTEGQKPPGLADERAREASAVRADAFRAQATAIAEQIQQRYPDLKVITHALKGDPAKRILETAADLAVEVIVVGNRRVQGISRVLGSVAVDILRDADCAVHVVKTT